MVTIINELTNDQKSQMEPWANKWIEIGLRTGNADRAKFEESAKKCYEFAGIPWHGNVVWVSSPLAMAFASPTSSFLIELLRNKNVRGAVRDAVVGAVDGAVVGAVGGAVHGAVGDAVGDAVGGAVDGAVVGDFKKSLMKVIKNSWYKYLGGQFWVGGYWYGAAGTSFFRENCNLKLKGDLWDRSKAYEETMESACWWYPHKDFIIVCERPVHIHRELVDENITRGWGSHRLHSDNCAAVGFSDGWGIYSIHGVNIPFKQRYIVTNPEQITVDLIEMEENAEVRRVMMERYGYERYIQDCNATVVHAMSADHKIIGLRSARLLVKSIVDDEPVVYVDLLNSTPEPDGSVRRYLMRVDPNAYDGEASRNCHAAAASTWRDDINGKLTFENWRDYVPAVES